MSLRDSNTMAEYRTKNKTIYLGIAAAYVTLAIVQITRKDLLPLSLYSTVAFVSLELTLLELLKTIAHYIELIHLRRITSRENAIKIYKEYSDAFSRFQGLEKEVEENEKVIDRISNELLNLKKRISIKILRGTVKWLTIFQIIFCCVQVALSLTHTIPYDLSNEKTTNAVSLVSFAALIASYYFNGLCEETLAAFDEKMHGIEVMNKYHMLMYHKIIGISEKNKAKNNSKEIIQHE